MGKISAAHTGGRDFSMHGVCNVRCSSYSSHDPVRKGGSDKGEEKPENRAVVMINTEGCIFLTTINLQYFCMYANAAFSPLGYM